MPDDYAGNTSTTGILPPSGNVSGSLETAGDQDWFKLTVASTGDYILTARSPTADLELTLYRENTNQVASDDDSGGGVNGLDPQIHAHLTPGVYYAAVYDYSPTETGNYTLSSVFTATNTAPFVNASQVFSAPENQTAVGTVTGGDVDGDTFTFAFGNGASDDSLFNIASDGTLTFKAAPDFEGKHGATYSLDVVATDSHGAASTPQTVTVNVTDVNDNTPVLKSYATQHFTEATDASNQSFSVTNASLLTVTDADTVGSITASAGDGVAYLNGAPVAVVKSPNITFDTVASTGGDVTVHATLTYTTNADYLAAGDVLDIVLPITVTDGANPAAPSNVVVAEITGTNDVPVIGGTTTGAVTEAGGTGNGSVGSPTATGTLTIVDPDHDQSSFQPVSTATATTHGTYTLGANGAWSYSLNNGDAAVQALAPGQTLSDSFTAISLDGTGSQVVTLAIGGSDDAPVLGAVTASAAFSGSPVTLSPGLTVADPDTPIASAAVTITAGFTSGDVLTAATGGTSVSASYNASTGLLTLTGADTTAHYQQVLESVAFSHGGINYDPMRTIAFTATDTAGVASNTATESVSVPRVLPASPPPATTPSTSATQAFEKQFGAAIGVDIASAKAASPTITAPDGTVLANPTFQTASAAFAIEQQLRNQIITSDQAKEALIGLAGGTTAVAEESYKFFTGKTVTPGGLAYLVNSDGNTNDLTDGYYAQFSQANRYINFAVNLGTGQGEGASAFAQAYGALSFDQAVRKAYDAILGNANATAVGVNVENAIGYIESQQAYFRALGAGSDIGAKAAAAGYILSLAWDNHLGAYYTDAHAYVAGLITTVGSAPNVEVGLAH